MLRFVHFMTLASSFLSERKREKNNILMTFFQPFLFDIPSQCIYLEIHMFNDKTTPYSRNLT